MKRRRTVSREPAVTRHRKAAKPKRSTTSKTARRASSSVAELQKELERQERELNEAHEQQTAAAEVLRLISVSSGDLQRVFAAILENATRLCQANFGTLLLCEGDFYRQVAFHNAPPAFVAARRLNPIISMSGSTALARLAATKQPVHIADAASDQAYQIDPQRRRFLTLTGVRTNLAVPMLIDDKLIGAINIYRTEVHPFTEKQIELVKNFAAQAVIAIENARLLNELRQRTDDLTESLEQQTATSEVLRVISSSPGDLQPVFATMLENAVRICDATFGNIYRWDGEALHLIAMHNTPPNFAEHHSVRSAGADGTVISRMLGSKAVVHVTDLASEQAYADRIPGTVAAVELGGVRTLLAVPMLKDNELVGALALSRQEVRPFTDKQIELVKNFAAQAVIAIENTRLLSELRQRTTDLTESLQQQTATSEVLRVISSSPGDLQPVFARMLENAVRICDAKFGTLFRFDGKTLRPAAQVGTPLALVKAQRLSEPLQETPGGLLDRVRRTKQVIYSADRAADAVPGLAARFGGARSTVGVPMLKDDDLVGAIIIYRQEVRPFTDKQIELVKNFAAQAVIAIENARLLNELRQRTDDLSQRTTDLTEALERQTASD